jgi:hypothetical protein
VLATATYASSVSDVSRILHLSEGIVRNYLSAAIGKTGARNRTLMLGPWRADRRLRREGDPRGNSCVAGCRSDGSSFVVGERAVVGIVRD